MRTLFFALLCMASCTLSFAQTDAQLMEIKDQTDMGRLNWNKLFDEGVERKNFSALAPARQQLETYIDENFSALRRAVVQGDERPMLVAVKNYLQIQRQFVKDIMIPAESLDPADAEGIAQINQKINDFAAKEKIFILEINNALRTAHLEGYMPPAAEPRDDQNFAPDAQKSQPHRTGKLPHEQQDGTQNADEGEEEEE